MQRKVETMNSKNTPKPQETKPAVSSLENPFSVTPGQKLLLHALRKWYDTMLTAQGYQAFNRAVRSQEQSEEEAKAEDSRSRT